MTMVDREDDMVKSKSFNVLVVDDDPVIRKLHEMYIKRFGLMTQVVENGQKAVDRCHFGVSFNLIITDREMPTMDGLEANKELRAMRVNSLIVGVTSHGLPDEKQAFMEAGLGSFELVIQRAFAFKIHIWTFGSTAEAAFRAPNSSISKSSILELLDSNSNNSRSNCKQPLERLS